MRNPEPEAYGLSERGSSAEKVFWGFLWFSRRFHGFYGVSMGFLWGFMVFMVFFMGLHGECSCGFCGVFMFLWVSQLIVAWDFICGGFMGFMGLHCKRRLPMCPPQAATPLRSSHQSVVLQSRTR